MSRCSSCHADLAGTGAFDTSPPECPFCGTRLSLDETAEPVPESSESDLSPSNQTLTPPRDSRIQVAEVSEERLVLHLPPGGDSTASLGCFAVMWNGFMCIFTPPWIIAIARGEDVPVLPVVAFLAVFWLIGLAFIAAWVRMKKLRTFLLIEPHRASLQTDLFGRKKLKSTPLPDEARADLKSSYEINDKPVYHIALSGTERTLKFGTPLSQQEKDWLVAIINDFLSADEPKSLPSLCPTCGAALSSSSDNDTDRRCEACGASVARVIKADDPPLPVLRPMDLPPESPIQVEEFGPDRLQFSLPVFPMQKTRVVIALIAAAFGLIWIGTAGVELFQRLANGLHDTFDAIAILFSLATVFPGLVILFLGWTAATGRIRITIDRERLTIRWGRGPLSFRQHLATPAIQRVVLVKSLDHADTPSRGTISQSKPDFPFPAAIVQAGDKTLPLTLFHPFEISQPVASLVKTHLESLGVELAER